MFIALAHLFIAARKSISLFSIFVRRQNPALPLVSYRRLAKATSESNCGTASNRNFPVAWKSRSLEVHLTATVVTLVAYF